MEINTDMVAQREKQVWGEIARYARLVLDLESITKELDSVLQPAIWSKPEKTDKLSSPEIQSLCKLAEDIRTNNESLESRIKELRYILNRLEI